MRAGHHHGSDTPTSARAILHHTDQNGPNILTGSVVFEASRVAWAMQLTATDDCNMNMEYWDTMFSCNSRG